MSGSKEGQARAAAPAAKPKQPSAESAMPLATALQERLGNAELCALLEQMREYAAPARVPSQREEPDEQARNASAGLLAELAFAYGRSLQGLHMRIDQGAAHHAASAGALAYQEGLEIGFASGAFSPHSLEGRHRIAHEYAHAVQRAGGNHRGAPPLNSVVAAEVQADLAAHIALAGGRPVLSAFLRSMPLYDKGKGTAGITVKLSQAESWVASGMDISYEVFRIYLKTLYPGATDQDAKDALAAVKGNLNFSMNLDASIRKARKEKRSTVFIPIFPTVDKPLRKWLVDEKHIDPGAAAESKSGAGGKDEGEGTGGEGGGKGTGKGKGDGSGGGEKKPELGVSKEPGKVIKAKNAADAVEQVQKELNEENEKKNQVELADVDKQRRFWPEEYADKERRAKIIQVLKDIVGEVVKLPEGEDSKLPVSIKSDECKYLLQIAESDKETRDAVIAKLKGNGELKTDNGQTLAQKFETAFENVEIEKNAEELGVKIEKGPPSTDPSKIPIENRPVRGRIVNEIGALTPGERSVWKLRVDEDRDAFRVPHIGIAWLATRTDPDTNEKHEVSSETTRYIPINSQGIMNDSEFDFTVRKPGPHLVKCIVTHNFFRPAYFEEPFTVEEEFPQSNRAFDENNKGLISKADAWDTEFFDHGGDFDYRLGRMRRGKLDPKAKATTDQDLIDNIEEQKKMVKDNIEALCKQDESRREALEESRDARLKELDEQIEKLKANKVSDAKSLVARGQFTSRVREIDDAEMKLSCSLKEVTVTDEDGKTRTEFLISLNDATARGSRQVYHWAAQANSVEAAQRQLFLSVAEAYPFGTVSVLFQGYDYRTHQTTSNFVQFQKKTDTVSKDIKSVVFDETVDTLVNVVGFILTIIPVTAPIGITITIVYNSAKALSENIDDSETDNFQKKKGFIALGDLVLNLLPLAPKLVKVGKGTYWAIKAASIGGGVVLMTAVGLSQVRDLRTNYCDALVRKKQRLEDLKKNNKAHPELVSGSLQREIDELTKKTVTATQEVFTTMAAQAAFMHVVSTAADIGLKGFEPGPVETRLLPELEARKKSISGLKEQGGFEHQSGGKPHYDYKKQKVIADEDLVSPQDLNRLSKEGRVDRSLEQAGVAPKERAALGKDLSTLDMDIVPGGKTEVVVGPKGKPQLRVKSGATGPEIKQALKDAPKKAAPKPDPKATSTKFRPLDEPLPGTKWDKLGKRVNAALSERARAAHGDVQVEIVQPGEFGPSKTKADVRVQDGKTILRFEGEPRPGVMAEEIAHLEQLADPKFSEQRAALKSSAERNWSEVSDKTFVDETGKTQVGKVDAHKARLELEADAQKRVIADLEAQIKDAKKVSPDDPRLVDIDNAYQNLEQIRAKLEQTVGIKNELETHGGIVDRPDFLDDRPTLTHKKTTNKYPLKDKWKNMTEKQFVDAYKKEYPDTTLTDAELRQRYKNGQRLNPESGRLKDPNLVENAPPDVAAKLKNEQEIDVDALNIGKAEKKRIKDLLAERDRARKARDKARDNGDEASAGQEGAKVNEASRKIGEAHAEAYMKENYPDFERAYPTDANKPSRSGDFDQVWVRYGKGKGKTKVVVEVIIIEAKGGSSPLGTRKVGGVIAQQGTGLYYKGIAESMANGTPEMQRIADILTTLKPKDITYKVVRTPIEMTPGAKPQSVVVKVEVADADLAGTMKKK